MLTPTRSRQAALLEFFSTPTGARGVASEFLAFSRERLTQFVCARSEVLCEHLLESGIELRMFLAHNSRPFKKVFRCDGKEFGFIREGIAIDV